ncbi:MAG: DevR family CRISPR-associated autoregulator [Acidilobaceae archaeon]|jgi:CRISPR-associated protein Csa2
MGVYLSMSVRVLANVEALNAVESLGNIIRHRKATIVIPRSVGTSRRLELVSVPVISGEALRHGYQCTLASLASVSGKPVCTFCSTCEFVKHGVRPLLEQFEPQLYNAIKGKFTFAEKERVIIENCFVEDVGGFLIPLEPPVRRTSRLYISYMIPSLADLKFSSEVQFHTRGAPQANNLVDLIRKEKERVREEERPQSLYYVESSSAVYTFSATLDLSGIGVTSNCDKSDGGKLVCEKLDGRERLERARLAILALAELVKGGVFGGKQSSYRPHWIPLSVVISISRPLRFMTAPAHKHEYIRETYELTSRNATLLKGDESLKSIGLRQGIETEFKVIAFIDKDHEDTRVRESTQEIQDNSFTKYETYIVDAFNDATVTALGWLKEEIESQKVG